jgi:hypothetical protein
MKRKLAIYTDSKIELRLVHYVGKYYHVEYRFLDIDIEYKFLFLKWTKHHQNSRWHEVIQYSSPIRICLTTGDPDDELWWNAITYEADDFESLEYFKRIKEEISTYEQMDREFELSKRREQYKKDKEEYNQILQRSKETIDSIS